MTVNIKLLLNKKPGDFGHAIVILVSHGQIRREREIGRSFEKNFDFASGNVLESHPDFDVLAPKILSYKLQARKIIASGIVSPDEAMKFLFGTSSDVVLFADYGRLYASELKSQAVRFEKMGDVVKRNKLLGNA